MRSLSEWRAAFERADRCPYVGPRPQTASDKDLLIGREPDIERITRAVLDRPLVVLHGYSGCGKSSLLQNGLYHALPKSGYRMLVARNWGGPPAPLVGPSEDIENQVERYLARAVKLTHEDPRAPIPVPDDIELDSIVERGQLGRILDERFRDAGVVVLDQFEELLRQDNGTTASAIIRWIIKSGYQHDTHYVISLRTDSLHLLDPLLRGVKPHSMDRVFVSELTDPQAIEEVIRTTKADSDSEITDGAVIELMRLWREHEPKPRLLDLQATLYALYFLRKTRSSLEPAGALVTIDDGAVRELVGKAGPGQDPFRFGLRDAIRLKMSHAEDACRHHGLDEYLICGAREMVRRAAPFLSSRDFKVPVDEIELARKAVSRELGVLESALVDELDSGASRDDGPRLVDDTVTEMFRAFRRADDFLSVRLPRLTRRENSATTPRPAAAAQAGRVSARDVPTAGPMMGSTATATLFEEIRRVVFAIEWLQASEIVRRDPDGTLLLVHDGSGSALGVWAHADETGPRYALRQLTGARGEQYMWEAVEIRSDEDDEYEVIANLSWRDCRIFGARFHKVVFVNCDFRRSQFESCSFSGTTFVNCLLDDANFERCDIQGPVNLKPETPEAEYTLKATPVGPSFTVATTPSEARFFAHYPPYPQVNGERARFFSDTSGVAAQPGGQPPGDLGELICHFVTGPEATTAELASGEPTVLKRTPASGGVAMVGGRLCMLTIYRCRSVKGGSFAFYYVSGSGLDIVEQDGGTVEIYDAAIRGISVSRDPDRSADRHSQPDSFALNVKHSFLANVYFAGESAGSATIQDSRVLMLINASDNAKNQGFRVQIKNSRYQFLVNTDEPDDKSVEDSRQEAADRYFDPVEGTDSRFDVMNGRRLAEGLERMDYRSHPEEWEEEQRERWALARVSVQARERGRRPGGPRVWNR